MASCNALADDPPYAGTVYVDPDWITPADRSFFSAATPAGRMAVQMYDRRIPDWTTVDARSFTLNFAEGVTVMAHINPEFSSSTSESLAEKWGTCWDSYRSA